jgi:excisionase family DNA binding protein
MDEKQYSVQEISQHFDVSKQTVHNWINSGQLRAIRLGRIIRIPQSALDNFVKPVQPGEPLDDDSDK